MLAEVHAFEQPIVDNLVKDGKLTEKQKEEILNEHEKNLQNLQKQHEIGRTLDLLTPYLLVSSTDNFCKQFGLRSGPTKCLT